MKTIALPEDVYKELINLKLKEGNKTAAELIKKLVIEYRKKRFLEASLIFRKTLKEKGIDLRDVLRESRRIREEIADEWLSD